MSSQSSALTLVDAYHLAYSSDQEFQSARFALEAARKEYDIGLSYLLPTLSAGGKIIKATGTTDLDTNSVSGYNSYSTDTDYLSKSATLTLKQPVFDLERLAIYDQGKAKALMGEQQFIADQQSLYGRLTQNYFDILRLQQESSLLTAQEQSIQELVKRASHLYENGEGTITDIDEAQARLDLIAAQKVDVESQLQNSMRKLNQQIGVWPTELLKNSEELSPLSILKDKNDFIFWRDRASKQSPVLAIKSAAVGLATSNQQQKQAGHTPKVSVAGQLSRSHVNQTDKEQDRFDKTIALMVDIPLYAGGGVSAYNQKDLALLTKSKIDLDDARLKINLEVEKNYLAISNGFLKCKALASAIRSNQKALLSAKKGVLAGERSTIDILNAEDRVFSAKRDFLNTKLKMLQSYVSLKTIVGDMDLTELKLIEKLLD